MTEEVNNIELRSEEVQEILGHIPSRIIRYGVTVILSVVLVLFVGSFFFKYPDILSAPVEVISHNAPAAVTAKASGNLTSLFVVDSQQVAVNTVLGVIKNPANYSHVNYLSQQLKTSEPAFADTGLLANFPDTLQLGSIQNSYAAFLKGATDYYQFRQLDALGAKIQALEQKSIELQRFIALAEQQVVLKEQEYELAANKFVRDSSLYRKEVLSLAEFENARKEFIQQGLALGNTRSAAVNARMQMQELRQQLTDYKLEKINQEQSLYNYLQQLGQNLESELNSWFDTFVLLSPMDGIVAFNKIWTRNQMIQSGQEVFTIIPLQESRIIGRVTLPVQGAGKVRSGQAVNLKFGSFPHQEFGMVHAQVSSVSLVPAEQYYVVEIQLPDTLITNYGFVLPFTQKMQGTAEIITDNLPLIVRLFNPLKSVLKKHWAGETLPKVKS
ncbi:MAG: HlyD family secretion protein [Salinivirgaceae bacterium]